MKRIRPLLAAALFMIAIAATFAAPAAGRDYSFVGKWALNGKGGPLEAAPNGDIYHDGYLADNPATAYDPFGAFRLQWFVRSLTASRLVTATADEFAFDPAGFVYAYVEYPVGGVIGKYTTAGTFVGGFPPPSSSFTSSGALAADTTGNLYMMGGDSSCPSCVFEQSPSGAVLARWSTLSDYAEEIAVDSYGFVYLGDTDEGVIRKFTGAGGFVTSWQVPAVRSHEKFGEIEAGPNGSIYVYGDGLNGSQVMEFSSTGTLLGRFSLPGYGGSLAVGSSGLIYASLLEDQDSGTGYVYVHRPELGKKKCKKRKKGKKAGAAAKKRCKKRKKK